MMDTFLNFLITFQEQVPVRNYVWQNTRIETGTCSKRLWKSLTRSFKSLEVSSSHSLTLHNLHTPRTKILYSWHVYSYQLLFDVLPLSLTYIFSVLTIPKKISL